MNAVAQRLEVRSLTVRDFDRERERMIDGEARRRTGRHTHQPDLLAELLPNSAQIERIARQVRASEAAAASQDSDATATDEEIAEAVTEAAAELEVCADATGSADWDKALEIAGLEPRQTLEAERSRNAIRRRGLPLAEAIHHFV